MIKNLNRIFTLFSFLIPLVIYCLTMAPTTSFWDCGEYIATSRFLGVPHPPGSPLFLLLGNFFSNIPLFSDIGARVNLISPIASALSVTFLYLIIVYIIEEFKGKVSNVSDVLIVYVSAFIGAITFAVTDAHWFNAVEAEIYALSTFFTSIVVWMILKWNRNCENNLNIKYLLIIAYMFGLATGLHLLNLLTLPFVALIIYFKKFKYKISTFVLTVFITLLVFSIIYMGIIKGIPDITNKTGSLFFPIIIPILIIFAILANLLKHINVKFSYSIVGIALTSILILLINAKIESADTIYVKKYNELLDIKTSLSNLDEKRYKLARDFQNNNLLDVEQNKRVQLENIINKQNNLITIHNNKLESYLKFEEVKDKLSFIELLKWQSNITIFLIFLLLSVCLFLFYKYLIPNYNQSKPYINFFLVSILLILIGYSTYIMIFIRSNQYPQINENSPDTIERALAYMNRDQYGDWNILDFKSTLSRAENTNWSRYTYDRLNPSKLEQLNFFINYQVNEMYMRYFAWQFIGKGEKENYPWYIKDLNNNLIGNEVLDGINWTRYGIPLAFILGIIGCLFHFSKDWKKAFAILSLFLATGLMIIIYLNQYDPQPRERDYSYMGSFFAFSIWIGIGISAIQIKIKDFFEDVNISSFISISFLLFTFILMPVKILATDYYEHDRSKNYVAWDYGYNLLNSCEPHGILFTNGDNDTFPLWYLQEVEGIRKDVKVINLSLLNTPWYIDQLMYQEPILNIDFLNEKLKKDIYKIDPWNGTEMAFNLCSNNFTNKDWEVLECELNTKNNKFKFNIRPTLKGSFGKLLRVQDAMILKIIHDVGISKPIYFAATVSPSNQLGLQNYLQMEGMTYKVIFEKNVPSLNPQKMKKNIFKSNTNKIIRNIRDYNQALQSNDGIYRYTNLDDNTIYFNETIQRQVQNYRLSFIRLAQNQLAKNKFNNELEIENIIDSMNVYFNQFNIPIDPGMLMLIEPIYREMGDVVKQKEIIKSVFTNEKLSIKDRYDLFVEYIIYFEDINFVNNLIKYWIEIDSTDMPYDLQRLIANYLKDNLSNKEFLDYCFSIFKNYQLTGILNEVIILLEENGEIIQATDIVNEWLLDLPNNQELILMKQYLSQNNTIQ